LNSKLVPEPKSTRHYFPLPPRGPPCYIVPRCCDPLRNISEARCKIRFPVVLRPNTIPPMTFPEQTFDDASVARGSPSQSLRPRPRAAQGPLPMRRRGPGRPRNLPPTPSPDRASRGILKGRTKMMSFPRKSTAGPAARTPVPMTTTTRPVELQVARRPALKSLLLNFWSRTQAA